MRNSYSRSFKVTFWDRWKADDGPRIAIIIMLALSLNVPKKPREPPLIFAGINLYCRKVEPLRYSLPPIIWIYLYSNFRGGFWKTDILCNRVRNGRSRSSRVVDFGINRKGVCDFLFVIILHRFWNTASCWKLWIFPTPISFNALVRSEPFRINRAVVVPERGGTPLRQMVWSRNGSPENVVSRRRNAYSVPANQLRLRPYLNFCDILWNTHYHAIHATCMYETWSNTGLYLPHSICDVTNAKVFFTARCTRCNARGAYAYSGPNMVFLRISPP